MTGVPKGRNRENRGKEVISERMQENFPGLKDMSFQIDGTYQVPNTMHENRPILRHIIVNFQYIGGK